MMHTYVLLSHSQKLDPQPSLPTNMSGMPITQTAQHSRALHFGLDRYPVGERSREHDDYGYAYHSHNNKHDTQQQRQDEYEQEQQQRSPSRSLVPDANKTTSGFSLNIVLEKPHWSPTSSPLNMPRELTWSPPRELGLSACFVLKANRLVSVWCGVDSGDYGKGPW